MRNAVSTIVATVAGMFGALLGSVVGNYSNSEALTVQSISLQSKSGKTVAVFEAQEQGVSLVFRDASGQEDRVVIGTNGDNAFVRIVGGPNAGRVELGSAQGGGAEVALWPRGTSGNVGLRLHADMSGGGIRANRFDGPSAASGSGGVSTFVTYLDIQPEGAEVSNRGK